MQRLIYQISPIESQAGLAESLSGTLDIEPFELGSMSFSIPKGIDYFVTLSNVKDAIVLTGKATANVEGLCSRCLSNATMEIDSEVEGYYLLGEDSDVTGMAEDEYELIGADGKIDLSEAIESAILVELPMIFLCRDDCKGLCPKCGINLNEKQCDCADQIDDSNPFAVLKDFFKDETSAIN